MKKLLLTSFALASMVMQAQTWTTQNSAFPNASTYPSVLSIVNANTVWALGADGSPAGANYQVYSRTSDGGATWTSGSINVGGTANQIADLAASSATTAYAAYILNASAKGGVYKTTNGGTSWTKVSTATMFSNTASFPDTIQFWDDNNGLVMGDPISGYFEIYTTTNGGTSWTRVPSANIPAPLSGEYGYTTIDYVNGENYWFGTNMGRIYKTSNRGLNWTVVQSPISDFGTTAQSGTFAIKDSNNAWLLDRTGVVLYNTTDGGATWNIINSTGTFYTSDLVYVPGTAQTLISAGASTTSRGSSISTDGGLTWTDLTPATGDTQGIAGLAAFDSSSIYGGGFNTSATVGGMNKLSPLMATSETKALDKQVSVYPNPTKGDVKVVSKSGVRSLQLVDMSGKVVKNYSNITQLDLSGMKSGVYMLQVTTADGKTSSTKIVKE